MIVYRPNKLALELTPGALTYVLPHPLALEHYHRWSGVPETSLIEWAVAEHMPPGLVFLDIGANIGNWSFPFAASGKPSRIHAWEPQRSMLPCLMAGIALNDYLDLIEVHRVALGSPEQVGTAMLHVRTEAGGDSSLRDDLTLVWSRDETVVVRTLDSYALENIGLVKIDVEGSELNVLRGALTTLERSGWPSIFFEAWSTEWYKPHKEELFMFLRGLGYEVSPINHYSEEFVAVHSCS